MPKRSCHGLAEIHAINVRQLATRPERTCSVAEKKYCPVAVSRSQYIAAIWGRSSHQSSAPAAAQVPQIAITRRRGTRRRLIHARTAPATKTLITEPRENESTSAPKKTAPPAASSLRDTGESA